MNALSSFGCSLIAVFGAVLVLPSCNGGIKESVDTLRAQHLEIVDTKGATQMDVGDRIRALEERVQKLEAELAKRDAEPRTIAPAAPLPSSPSPLEDAGTATTPARAKPARSVNPLSNPFRQ
jgi:hypothetical protein